jgi:hypothetical protein
MPSSPAFTSSTAQTSSNPSFSSPAPPPPATTFNSPSLAAPNHSELRVRFLRFIKSRVHISQSLQAPIPPYLTASPQPSTWQTPSALSLLCSIRSQTRSPRHPHRGTCSAPSRAGAAFPGSGCRNHRQDRALRRAPASQKAANSTKLLAGPQHPSLPSQDLETQKNALVFPIPCTYKHDFTHLVHPPPIKLFSNAQPANIDYRSPSPGPRKQLLTHATGTTELSTPKLGTISGTPTHLQRPGHVRTPTSHARHPRIGSA